MLRTNHPSPVGTIPCSVVSSFDSDTLNAGVPLARGRGPRDIPDHGGELLRARPHRPVARRQGDPGEVAEGGETTEPRVALLDRGLVLVGREPRADCCARHVESRVVGQLRRLAQYAARLGHGPSPEGLELLLTEPLEVLALLELLPRRQGLLDAVELGVQCTSGRAGAD